ncbi:unnamed protein product [Periconia digitata]|uniref:PNPLA domain-containing protein n=1 Tax=Periconia digitata TaxID=1303443 RepID=A0A9W4XVI0_9PLEO|nr:unnamed protein product [Periconia digitata]
MEQATATSTKYGGDPNPLDTTGLCLLSLDGGGVRGLSTLYILKSIMDRLNYALKKDRLERGLEELPPMRPCEVFDLIGGTNTGGLIAVMLGRLEMDVDECIDAYSELAAAVFGEKLTPIPVKIEGEVKPQFDSARLETAIRKVVTRGGAPETALFNDGIERGCKTFVCTVDRDTCNIIRLRSYSLPHESNIPSTICQAALATSATTTFFESVSIGHRSFTDGQLGANNPVDQVEGEAGNIWCPETGELKPLVKCFISIGTGNPGNKAFEDKTIDVLSQTVVEIAKETENTERKFIDRWAGKFDEKRYFRFNVEQGLQSIGLEEYNMRGRIEALTEAYITHKDRYFRMRDCVGNLRLKQSMAATNLSYLINEYNVRRTIALHTTPRAEAPWIMPFQRNPQFVGRASELAQINDLLANDSRCERVAIVGLGGVGKTQIALESAHRWREEHSHCAVFWIPVTNVESMLEAYVEIGRQLKIPNVEQEKADVQRLVQRRLSEESSGRWLIVFDNADDIDLWTEKVSKPADLGRRLDSLPKSKHGSILFTTRSRKAATKLAGKNVVSVSEMDDATAKGLLEKSLIDQDLLEDEQATADLLLKLTRLPLAIVQAAAYINENQISLSEYVALLDDTEQNQIELLSEEFEDEGRYEDIKNPIATTWLISFEQIRTRDPLAAEYLSFMACVDAKDIPQSLLPPAQSAKKAVDAVGMLSAYSFVSKHKTGQLLDLHRLVHLATRNWLRTEGRLGEWAGKAVERLEEVFPDDDHSNRAVWRMYLPHVRYALGLGSGSGSEEVESEKTKLLWKFGKCARSDGRDVEAEKAFEQVVKIRRRELGAEHPDTLSSMRYLGSTYRNQGRWKEAEELFVQVMEASKEVLGEEHPNTLAIMASLATTYNKQGRWKEAEKLRVQDLETSKRVLGEEHPSTLTSMKNLASTYSDQGRWKEAEELEVHVLEIRKRVLGAEHPSTLRSMNNLAYTWKSLGRHTEALKLMEECVKLRIRIMGVDHPHTLSSSTTLSRWQIENLEIGDAIS